MIILASCPNCVGVLLRAVDNSDPQLHLHITTSLWHYGTNNDGSPHSYHYPPFQLTNDDRINKAEYEFGEFGG